MMKIASRNISKNDKAFIIGEIGLSHNGSLKKAVDMIDKISSAGADAVKFQMHIAEYESSKYEKFRKGFKFKNKSRFDYWKKTSFDFNEWKYLRDYTKKKKLSFLCSPFSVEAVKRLKSISVDAWKIPSGEFNNLFMINEIIRNCSRPIILSTGLTYLREMTDIIKYIKNKNKNVALLQCTSMYPTPLEKVGHNLISEFSKKYKILTGVSDHSGNINSSLASISLGAKIIEIHTCFKKTDIGPDVKSSITFEELKAITSFNNDFYKIKVSKVLKNKLSKNQIYLRRIFTKSLALDKNLIKNSKIKYKDLIDLKPFRGISIFDYKKVIGKKINKTLQKGTFLQKKDIGI